MIPLALLAIIATLGFSKVATETLWDVSKQRYAEEIIRTAVKSL